jgi:excisionase family DNA binding protein
MCDKLLLTVVEAAHQLGIKRSLTYRFIQDGSLKSIKVGGARRVLVSDLHQFVDGLKQRAADHGDE